MPKKKSRRKNIENEENTVKKSGFFDSGRERKTRSPEEKRESLRFIGLLVCWGVFLTVVYVLFISVFDSLIILHIYAAAAVLLFIAYFFANGGIARRDFDDMERPDNISEQEFKHFRENLKKRKKLAKLFFVGFIPFVFIICIDYLILIWL